MQTIRRDAKLHNFQKEQKCRHLRFLKTKTGVPTIFRDLLKRGTHDLEKAPRKCASQKENHALTNE